MGISERYIKLNIAVLFLLQLYCSHSFDPFHVHNQAFLQMKIIKKKEEMLNNVIRFPIKVLDSVTLGSSPPLQPQLLKRLLFHLDCTSIFFLSWRDGRRESCDHHQNPARPSLPFTLIPLLIFCESFLISPRIWILSLLK